MKREEVTNWSPSNRISGRSDWRTRAALPAFFLSLGGAAAVILVHDGRGRVLFLSLLAGALLLGFKQIECRFIGIPHFGWRSLVGPISAIVLVTFALYLPTLNIYFISDDFGCLHAFHHLSLGRFIEMFHSDLAQVVEGESGQEIRPFYALYYMIGYKLWGLHPMGFHVVAIVADILNCLLVFGIANTVAPGNIWRACVAGLLFAVQPVHSSAVSWIAGSSAEIFPTLFYLSSFLLFIQFRTSSRMKYLGLSLLSFVACLMCKEIAVTLPVMLVSFDCFQMFGTVAENEQEKKELSAYSRRRRFLVYVPYALLLLVYLAWRQIVFSHFLGEDFWAGTWSGSSQGQVVVASGFLHHLGQFARYMGGHHVFNIRAMLLPLPTVALAFVLGFFLICAAEVNWRPSENRNGAGIILYFGLAWYLISDLPLLVASPDERHLYLPAVGPCIALALLAMPTDFALRRVAAYSRSFGLLIVVILFGWQLRKANQQFIQLGEISEVGTRQIVSFMETVPQETLVIIRFPEDAFLPFALQEPFVSDDVYSRASIVEQPSMSGFSLNRWWEKTRPLLGGRAGDAQMSPRQIDLLTWLDQGQSFGLIQRTLSAGELQACTGKSLGESADAVTIISLEQANGLVNDLAGMVQGGNCGQPWLDGFRGLGSK